MGYSQQLLKIGYHPVVRTEVAIVRFLLLVTARYFSFQLPWHFDSLFVLYLLFAFKSMLLELFLLTLWVFCRTFVIDKTASSWQLTIVEIVMICSLAFKKFGNDLIEQPQEANTSTITTIEAEQQPTEPNYAEEQNQVQFELIERYPVEMTNKPSYFLLLTELAKQPWYVKESMHRPFEGFLLRVANSYNKVPYHGLTHGLDVAYVLILLTQSLYLFLNECRMKEYLQLANAEYMFMLVAGFCHDVGHEGLRNSFYTKTKHKMSLSYYGKSSLMQDNSILEHYHCSKLFSIARLSGCDVFGVLPEFRQSNRRLVVKMILSTDMAYHDQHLVKLQAIRHKGYDVQMQHTHRQAIQGELLHAADLQANSKSPDVSDKWFRLLYEQFWREDNMLAEMGLGKFPKLQTETAILGGRITFIEKFCMPLYLQLEQISSPFSKFLFALRANRDELERRMRSIR